MAETTFVNLPSEPSTPRVSIFKTSPCNTEYIINVLRVPSPNLGKTTIAGEREERPIHIRLKKLKKEAKMKVETPPPSYFECVEKGFTDD